MSLEVFRPRLPAVTSLRFFATFHVALFHMNEMGALTGPRWLKAFAGIGYVGVSFFFVLSGFILVYTYAGREIRLHDFWQARFARIYPAYLFSLLISFPFFYYGTLKMHISFFAFCVAALCIGLGAGAAAAIMGSGGGADVELGGVESLRGSVLLRGVSVCARYVQ